MNLLALLSAITFATPTPQQVRMIGPDHIEVDVPHDVSPTPLRFRVAGEYTFYGDRAQTAAGLVICETQMRHGNLTRLLLYCPGYELIAWESGQRQLADVSAVQPLHALPEALRFVKAEMVALRGRVANSSGAPIAGLKLQLTHSLLESMRFLGYIDGPSVQLELGTSVTNDRGEFAFRVPRLSRDPFVRKHEMTPVRTTASFNPIAFEPPSPFRRMDLRIISGAPWPGELTRPWVDEPAPGDKPVSLVMLRSGRVQVTVGPDTCKALGLPARLTGMNNWQKSWQTLVLEGVVDGSSRWHWLHVDESGRFIDPMGPGKYDLVLREMRVGDKEERRVLLKIGVGVPEGGDLKLDLP